MKKRSLSILCVLALCLSLLPVTALADGDVAYQYYDTDSEKWTTGTKSSEEYTTVSSSSITTTTTWSAGWYVVSGSVSSTGDVTITVNGDVNLILPAGSSLTLGNGRISINDNSTLTIYGQESGSGSLTLKGTSRSTNSGISLGSGSSLVIHGGDVTATGYCYNKADTAPGIDVGTGTLTVYGGTVNATAGAYSGAGYGAGIRVVTGGTVNIHGGSVTAQGASNLAASGTSGAGIGGSGNTGNGSGETCGTVNISGGTVTATGGGGIVGASAGIGGGQGGLTGTGGGGTVTISGGTVTAKGGKNSGGDVQAPGIGGAAYTSNSVDAGSFSTGESGSAVITTTGDIQDTSKQSDWQGIIDNIVYGTVTLPESQYSKSLTVSENANLIIPDGAALSNSITVNDGGTLTVNSGSTITNSGTITNNGTLTGGGTISNAGNGTVTGSGTNSGVTITYPSTVSLSSEPDGTAVPNQAVTFTATVTGSGSTPTGTVQFKDNGNNLGSSVTLNNGKATYATSDLTVGEHTITAEYTGDTAYTGSSGTLTFTVVGEVESISIKTQPTKMSYTTGETLDLTGLVITVHYVGSTYTQDITWSEDSGITASIENGTTLSASQHNDQPITITYEGRTATTDALTVSKANQADFAFDGGNTKSVTYGDGTFPVTATGGGGSGEVTYTVTDGGDVVSIDDNTVTILKAGTATITATKAEDGDYNEATATLTVTVNKADPTVTVTPASGLTYTGQSQALVTGTTSGGTLVYSLTGGDDYTETIPTGTDAGDYTVWYKVNGNENYNNTTAQSVSVTIGKAAATVTKAPEAVTGLTYDGQAYALVTAGTAEGGEMQYSTDGSSYSATIPTGTDAGTYTVWYKVVGDSDHSDTQPVKIEVTIAGVSIAGATVELSASSFTYSGTEQKPDVTVKLGENKLTENTDYTVSFDGDTTNAGTVTVTVTGAGNYAGSTAATKPTYTIAPAEITITGATLAAKTYDGTADAEVTGVTFDGLVNGESLILGTDYIATAVYDSADAGDNKTVTVTVTLNHNNYTLAEGTYQLTGKITKADIGVTPVTGYVNADKSSTLTLPALPAGASYGEAQYNGGDDAITGLSVSGTTLSYTGGTIASGSTYEITVQVDGGNNYESTELTVTLIGTETPIVDITGVAAATGLVYNGAAQTGYTGTPAAGGYDGSFDVTYSADPVNAGSYTVTIAVPDGEGVIGSLTLSFTIEKAAITVTAPSRSIYVGDPIPEVSALGEASVSGLQGSDAFGNVALAYGGTPSSSQTGTYSIVPSGGSFTAGSADNYTIQYRNGTLTIQSRPISTYLVTVNGGTGGGSYEAGDTVTVTAAVPEGMVFTGWTGDVTFADPAALSTTFTMPAQAVTVTANFEPEPEPEPERYTVTLSGAGTGASGGGTGASGGGSYAAGDTVTVTAGTKSGYTFRSWTAEGVTLSNPASVSVSFSMPANDVTLTASWTQNATGSGSTGGGSSSSSDDDDDDYTPSTTTGTNSDGSTTTTTTKTDGTQVETTQYPDGSKEVVETAKDGTVTTTTTNADGSQTETVKQPDGTVTTTATDAGGNQTQVVENPDGSSQTTVAQTDGSGSVTVVDERGQVVSSATLSQAAVESAQAAGEAVALPMPSVPVTTDLESASTVTVSLPTGTAAQVEIPVENVTAGTVAVLVKADGTEEVVKTSIATETGVAVTLNDGDTVKIVDNSKAFADVTDTYWGSGAVAFVTSHELFSGTGETTFEPDTAMSRAMFVTVLARFDGVDTAAGDTWYEAGAAWAVEKGISDGANLDAALTREQLATMLYRYAQSMGMDTTQGGMAVREFADFEQISGFAAEAMTWAVNTGLITGTGDGALAPQGQASRAQVATILMRFIETGIQ